MCKNIQLGHQAQLTVVLQFNCIFKCAFFPDLMQKQVLSEIHS